MAPEAAGPTVPAALRRAVESFEDYLRVERGAAASTVRAYRKDLRRYLSHLADNGVRELDEIRPPHVSGALQALAADGASVGTINRALAAIRHFHRFCVRDGLSATEPASVVDGPRRGLALPRALRLEDVTRIIEAASGHGPRDLRDRAILELLYAGGVRVSELVGLDVDDVDLDDRTVRCLGKGDRERIVPIGRSAAEALARYVREGRPELVRAGRGTPALFLSVRGTRLSRQSAWKCVKRYAAHVDERLRVFPHALRHSFATHMVARGADVRVVQEALGHARLSTTQVYTLVSRETLKGVYDAAHPRGRDRGTRRQAPS